MGPHIIVCIKSVLVHAPMGRSVRTSDSCELNPFDRPALEAALRIKDEQGGSVTVISMGPDSVIFTLQEAIAMGTDRAILLSDPALADSDTLATSTALAAAIKKLAPFDLVLFGSRTADSDTGHVGPQTAILLELPFLGGAYMIERKEKGLIIERKVDGFRERFEVITPAAITIHSSAFDPRDLNLTGIRFAYDEGDVEIWRLGELGLSPEQVGDAGSPTKVLSLSRVDRVRKCEFLSGSTEEQATQLVQRLVETGTIF